jgi:hypothetical protein
MLTNLLKHIDKEFSIKRMCRALEVSRAGYYQLLFDTQVFREPYRRKQMSVQGCCGWAQIRKGNLTARAMDSGAPGHSCHSHLK